MYTDDDHAHEPFIAPGGDEIARVDDFDMPEHHDEIARVDDFDMPEHHDARACQNRQPVLFHRHPGQSRLQVCQFMMFMGHFNRQLLVVNR